MTHLLVPIKGINTRIESLSQDYNFTFQSEKRINGRIAELKNLLTESKRVSLSEEQIEAQHSDIVVRCEVLWKEMYPSGEERSSLLASTVLEGMVRAYKQALKDLNT